MGRVLGNWPCHDWGLAVGPDVGNRGLYFGTPAFMSVSCFSGNGQFILAKASVQTDSFFAEPHGSDDVKSLLFPAQRRTSVGVANNT